MPECQPSPPGRGGLPAGRLPPDHGLSSTIEGPRSTIKGPHSTIKGPAQAALQLSCHVAEVGLYQQVVSRWCMLPSHQQVSGANCI